MLNPDRDQEVFDRIKKFSTVDEVEVIFSSTHYSLTRFANNTIHQNVSELTDSASIRVAFDGKTARATTNRFDDEGLKRAVQSAESIARVQEPNPDLLPMASGQEAQPSGDNPTRWFEQTARITPADRAEAAGQIVATAKKNSLVTAGIYSSAEHAEAIINSKGLSVFHKQTSAEVSITMLADDSSGWQKSNSPHVKAVEHVRLAEIAARKARDSRGPRELPPGKYTVVLEPAAVLDLVGFMFWDFGGMAILDQRSFLNNRIGARLFGENITIVDDVGHPFQSGASFDGEGIRRQKVTLVENGVISKPGYHVSTADRMRNPEHSTEVDARTTTGHEFA